MVYKSTVISKDLYLLTCPVRLNDPLTIIDLEHQMTE
jgi:hypothetical protein